MLLINRLKTWCAQLWTHSIERWHRPQGFWHDPGPCGRCGSRVFYVMEDERMMLIAQCALCQDRKAA